MLYLIAALLCLARAGHPQRQVWWAIALVLLVLGLARLANLEQVATDVGRQIAISQEWYTSRRPIQSIGIFGIVLGSGLIAICIFALTRRLRAAEAIGILAAGGLVTLIAIRSISLHSVDALVGRHLFGLFGIQLGWLLEMLLLICIVGAALWPWHRFASRKRRLY
jgi:hypothetical protein